MAVPASSNQANQTHGKMGLKSKIPLCSDYSEYSVADLRALVVSAVKSGEFIFRLVITTGNRH